MLVSNASSNFYSQVQGRDSASGPASTDTSNGHRKAGASIYDSVTIDPGTKNMGAAEKDIASRYDVTNLSENERIAMAGELFDNNLISPAQYAVMSFPMQEAVSRWPGYEGTVDPDRKENFLQQSIDQLGFAKGANASAQEIQSRESVISLLENLHSIRNG